VTIREYFRARSKRARKVLGVGGLVVAVAVAILAMTDHLSREYSYAVTAAAVLGVAVMFGGLLYLDITKCPQCLARLGIQIANQYRLGRRVGFCPFCGVGFDKCEVRDP
jgi:uncharacterized membrane protein